MIHANISRYILAIAGLRSKKATAQHKQVSKDDGDTDTPVTTLM